MAKMFVGNLPFSATEEALKSLFETVGAVSSAVIIKDRETGRSRGFGFVEMSESEKAISELNDTEMEGRKIKVSEAREREGVRRNYGPGGGRESRGNR
jgi:RNA recognition motif-containing protein